MRVTISQGATSDLREIAYFIKSDNPPRAISFAGDLRAACNALGTSPLRYPLVPGRENSTVRRAAYRAYLIFYEVNDTEVTVLRILHSARNYQAILFPDD